MLENEDDGKLLRVFIEPVDAPVLNMVCRLIFPKIPTKLGIAVGSLMQSMGIAWNT